jgi:hypothetical protein
MKASLALTCAFCLAAQSLATPPLVTGDVPTADKQTFEWYLGASYQKFEPPEKYWHLPTTELVYGLTDRQEISIEVAGLSLDRSYDFGYAAINTKYQFLKETEQLPGIAGAFRLQLATDNKSRALGTGEFDYELQLRAQKTWGWFTAIGNVGYTWVTDAEHRGPGLELNNLWTVTFAQEYKVGSRTTLLSEIYYVSPEQSDLSYQFAGNIGFKHDLRENLEIHASIGKSLREHNSGGPDLLFYVGIKWTFGAPWRKPE